MNDSVDAAPQDSGEARPSEPNPCALSGGDTAGSIDCEVNMELKARAENAE